MRCRLWNVGVACFVLVVVPLRVAAQRREDRAGNSQVAHISRTQSFHWLQSHSVVASWPKNLAWGAMAGIALSDPGRSGRSTADRFPCRSIQPRVGTRGFLGEGQFREPHQVRIDREGLVWLVDSSRHVVKKFTPEGKLLLTLGTDDEPGKTAAHLNRPTNVAVTPGGEILVADGYGNNRIVHFDNRGQFVRTWGSLRSPRAVQPASSMH